MRNIIEIIIQKTNTMQAMMGANWNWKCSIMPNYCVMDNRVHALELMTVDDWPNGWLQWTRPKKRSRIKSNGGKECETRLSPITIAMKGRMMKERKWKGKEKKRGEQQFETLILNGRQCNEMRHWELFVCVCFGKIQLGNESTCQS